MSGTAGMLTGRPRDIYALGNLGSFPDGRRGTSRPCLGMSFCHCKGWSRGGRGGGRTRYGSAGHGQASEPRRSGGTSNAKMVTCVISGRGQYTSRVPLARTAAVCLILPLQYTYSIPFCLVYHSVVQGRKSATFSADVFNMIHG